ncbi:MAG: PilN domain-containing protein [Clostridia bacterium]|nr:PilN domain-containing protein [Clostridia bacterium]
MLKINLLPEEVKGDKRISSTVTLFNKIIVGALTVCFLLSIILHLLIVNVEKELGEKSTESRNAEKILEEFENLTKEKRNLQNQIDNLKSVETSFLWGKFFDQLQHRIPEGVWLTSVEGKSSEGVLLLVGESSSYASIRAFFSSLQSIEAVKNVELKEVKAIEGTNIYEFQVICSLGVKQDGGNNRESKEFLPERTKDN